MAVKPISPKDLPKFIESFKNGVNMLSENEEEQYINSWTGIGGGDKINKEKTSDFSSKDLSTKEADNIAFFVALEFVETQDPKLLSFIAGPAERFQGLLYGLLLTGYLEETENGMMKTSEIGKKKLEELRGQITESMKISKLRRI